MAEPQRYSPLAEALPVGRSGVLGKAVAVQLQAIAPSAMVQINGAMDPDALQQMLSSFNFEQPPGPLKGVSSAQLRLLWNGPGRFLAASEVLEPGALLDSLRAALDADKLSCVDLSHAYCVLCLSGPSAQEVLAKGCALDIESTTPHSCMPTAIGRFDVLLHRFAEDTFHLYVARSRAESFARWLLRAAAEFGVLVADGNGDEP